VSEDLFESLPDHAKPDGPVRIKLRGLYAAFPGTGPAGETCRSCDNLSGKRMSRSYYKCELTRAQWTGGPGTDVKVRSPACSKWKALAA
jgi:hypothetical protein